MFWQIRNNLSQFVVKLQEYVILESAGPLFSLYILSHSHYERLVQHYKHVGLSSLLHGNKGRVPPNTVHFDDVTQLTTFIVNYARAHGMPLPGRVPGHRDKVMVLSSDITKANVFTKYSDACLSNGWTEVG